MTILARRRLCERDKIYRAEFYGTCLGLGLKSKAPVAKDAKFYRGGFKTTLMPSLAMLFKCEILS
ncbi:hypothetical protein [uncultured Campylobacter sp.]|uniref:hypothetical protein n=1 Tax=uncultured Campylobacter sp. TaxID=218934 RepID=UPI0026060BB8|nr:hypothetical protein [uncultured Campylobacter sp.]